jgi:hypothetical protein
MEKVYRYESVVNYDFLHHGRHHDRNTDPPDPRPPDVTLPGRFARRGAPASKHVTTVSNDEDAR